MEMDAVGRSSRAIGGRFGRFLECAVCLPSTHTKPTSPMKLEVVCLTSANAGSIAVVLAVHIDQSDRFLMDIHCGRIASLASDASTAWVYYILARERIIVFL